MKTKLIWRNNMFTVHFLQKHLHASKTFGTLQISISSCVAKLPLQSQLGVIQPEQSESETERERQRDKEGKRERQREAERQRGRET